MKPEREREQERECALYTNKVGEIALRYRRARKTD